MGFDPMSRAVRFKEWLAQKSVLKKLLVSYIILLALLIVSNLFVYFKTKDLLISKEVTYNKMALDYTGEIMDQNIQGIYDSCVTLLSDEDVQKRLTNIDFIGNQTYLISQLLGFTQKNGLVEHAVLFNPSLDYILYEEGRLSMDSAFETYFQYEDWPRENLLERFERASIGYIPRSDVRIESSPGTDADSYITIYFSSQYVTGNNKLLLLLPENRLRELFKNAYDGNHFMIISEDGDAIVNPEQPIDGADLVEKLLASIRNSEEDHFSYEDFLVIHKGSSLLNWEYTVLINYIDIFRDVKMIRNIIIYLLLAISLTGVLVVAVSIRNNYLPLQEILNSVSIDNRDKEESEYDRIRHSILHLKKNNQTYRENQTLYDMIQCRGNEAELEALFPASCVCSVMLTGRDIDQAEQVKKYLENGIFNKSGEIRLIRSDKNEVYLILNDMELVQEQIMKELQHFFAEKTLKLIAGTGTVESVLNLKKSCENARKAFIKGSIDNPHGVYRLEDKPMTKYVYFPIDFESRMMSFIYAADKGSVGKLVEEILEQNKQIDWSSWEKLLMDFYESYKRLAHKADMEIDEKKWLEIFSRRYELPELTSALRLVYESLVFEAPVDKRAEYVGRYVKDYVQSHYMDSGITIEEIAGELNLVPTYVSTLFKKEAKISFSQYLSDYRIQKAKELLEQTDMKVKDIASETGFGTYNNFTRVFKKKLGVTPIEYKNQELK